MREPVDLEQAILAYEELVENLTTGYHLSIYEYTNDMSVRQRIENNRNAREVQAMWARVETADASLRSLLLPTKRCIHGDYPQASFWYWGYPPNSPELESDLRSRGAL